MEYTDRRTILITNPNSANAQSVEHFVKRPLEQDSVQCDWYATAYPDAQKNIAAIAEIISDGDRLIAASGDGVANQTLNAALLSERTDLELGTLGFGGFNDIAATFTGHGKKMKNPFPLLRKDTPISTIYPLGVSLDKIHQRYAALYFASGFCAQASELMDDEIIREKIATARSFKQIRMGIEACKTYFFNQNILPMPAFSKRFSDQEIFFGTEKTDILATNGTRMARILRDTTDWYAREDFRVNELDARGLIKSAPFLLRAVANNLALSDFALPGVTTSSADYTFDTPFDLTWQVDGEVSHATTTHIGISKSANIALAYLAPAKASKA